MGDDLNPKVGDYVIVCCHGAFVYYGWLVPGNRIRYDSEIHGQEEPMEEVIDDGVISIERADRAEVLRGIRKRREARARCGKS